MAKVKVKSEVFKVNESFLNQNSLIEIIIKKSFERITINDKSGTILKTISR